MIFLNATHQPMPGSTPVFDGKMRYYWPAIPQDPDRSTPSLVHAYWFTDILCNSGWRYQMHDFEGGQRKDTKLWLRSNKEQVLESHDRYHDVASWITAAVINWVTRRNLPHDYIKSGFYGFPQDGRRVATGSQTPGELLELLRMEKDITDLFTALYPSLYVRTQQEWDTLREACKQTRYALNFVNHGALKDRHVYVCVRPVIVRENKKPLTVKQLHEYLAMIEGEVGADGFVYWDGIDAWSQTTDKAQVLDVFREWNHNK